MRWRWEKKDISVTWQEKTNKTLPGSPVNERGRAAVREGAFCPCFTILLYRKSRGKVFDYTSYFLTVGLSNTVQLRLLGKYSVILELLESLLCCLTRRFFFLLLFFSDVIKTCYSTSVCQALRNQAYTNRRCGHVYREGRPNGVLEGPRRGAAFSPCFTILFTVSAKGGCGHVCREGVPNGFSRAMNAVLRTVGRRLDWLSTKSCPRCFPRLSDVKSRPPPSRDAIRSRKGTNDD